MRHKSSACLRVLRVEVNINVECERCSERTLESASMMRPRMAVGVAFLAFLVLFLLFLLSVALGR